MASLTSLYLCSRTVYAAVGSPTARGARITAAASTQLPEGCLINGVITNEADLAEALKESRLDVQLIEKDPEIAAAQLALPISVWINLCDREPEREDEAFDLIDRHIRQFFEAFKADE